MSNCKTFFVLVLVGALSVGAAVAQSREGSSRNSSFEVASSNLTGVNTLWSASLAATESSSMSSSAESSKIIAVPPPLPTKNTSQDSGRVLPFSRIAIATKIGTLGYGGQIATPITRWMNLRGGAHFFNFGYGLTSDGTNYYASLHMKSGTAQVDVFPFRHSSFHVSPGILIFRSTVAATMFVPGGNTFTENDTDYISSPSDPVHGSGSIAFSRSIMPALTVGFGNMITRRENRHWSVPFDIGAAYTGHNTIQINLAGSVCQTSGCGSVNDPSVQQNIAQQQAKINEDAKRFQIYPIISSGVSYRF
ncbi:MAG TPA: hypothetical protein VF865_15035 [Acidobacteriaceae bacterium]